MAYQLGSDLSGGYCYPPFEQPMDTPKSNEQAPVVQKVDSAIHRINQYPADNTKDCVNTYPPDSDLSGG